MRTILEHPCIVNLQRCLSKNIEMTDPDTGAIHAFDSEITFSSAMSVYLLKERRLCHRGKKHCNEMHQRTFFTWTKSMRFIVLILSNQSGLLIGSSTDEQLSWLVVSWSCAIGNDHWREQFILLCICASSLHLILYLTCLSTWVS